MKYLAASMLAVLLAGATAVLELPAPDQDQKLTDPEWVVIYRLTRKPLDPLMEFRIMIRAKSEGDAVTKCVILIQKTFGVNAIDILEFQEAALAKP